MRESRSFAVLLGVVAALAGCSVEPAKNSVAGNASMKNLVFLTRSGCVNTVTMRANLDDALKTLALPNDYQFIDADTLKETDPRGGYGTPTVLYAGRDLFEMDEPGVPHPAPT
jgi:hypothetical protein